ncbi:MAG: hypothetical protein O2822_08950 [Chloroflexi bacterium]|nr:hypothetical protein [Chloroflexota bacterium]
MYFGDRGRLLSSLGVGSDWLDIPDPEAEQFVIMAKGVLTGLEKQGVLHVLPIPEVSHEVVIDRMHRGSKPFGRGGEQREKGYRDFLIWQSVLELKPSASGALALVTGNTKDFAGANGELDRDLADEAHAAGHAITIFPSLDDFITKVVLPELPRAAHLAALLADDEAMDELIAWLEAELARTPITVDVNRSYESYLEDLTFDGFEVDGLQILDVFDLVDVPVAQAWITGNLLIHYRIRRQDAQRLGAVVRDNLDDAEPRAEIWSGSEGSRYEASVLIEFLPGVKEARPVRITVDGMVAIARTS